MNPFKGSLNPNFVPFQMLTKSILDSNWMGARYIIHRANVLEEGEDNPAKPQHKLG